MIDLKKHTAAWKITGSSAEVIAADIQAGCPAVVHVIDAVLIPALDEFAPAEATAAASATAGMA